MRSIILSRIWPSFLRTSREMVYCKKVEFNKLQTCTIKTGTNKKLMGYEYYQIPYLLFNCRQYSVAHNTFASEFHSDSKFDLVDNTVYQSHKIERSTRKPRGESEFWRRKMHTLHKVLDVNRDGVISFDDFSLLTTRFTSLGNLAPKISAEFLQIMKQTWEEQWGEINPYNLITAEQFLSVLHDKLNDKEQVQKIDRFVPYIFKAVDTNHSGYLDLEQYKLFFRCLGLSDEDAAISFAVIDKNSDGRLSLNEFVNLGRQFFLTENEQNISKMFWGPLTNH